MALAEIILAWLVPINLILLIWNRHYSLRWEKAVKENKRVFAENQALVEDFNSRKPVVKLYFDGETLEWRTEWEQPTKH